MGAQALISNLTARGISLTPNGDSLIVRPRDRLTNADREAIRQHKVELLALLTRAEQIEEAGIDRLARSDGWRPNPAESVVAACQRHGVVLRIDPDGTLVVGKAGAKADEPTQSWPSLLIAIKAHLEAVASLVEAGWTLKTEFPQTDVA